MKKNAFFRVISVILMLSMLFGMFASSTAAVADAMPETAESNSGTGDINYVSIGDSMTNGYGFEGYYQNDDSGKYFDILAGKGVYGAGAYPLQFEDYLKGQGYTVNHTKLATSAMLPEDFYYILGGMEEAVNDGWGGWLNYIGTYEDTAKGIEDVRAYVQKAVTGADLITMDFGGASFGAFLIDKVTNALGVFGASFDDYQLNLDLALKELDDEDREDVVNFVNSYISQMDLSMAEEMFNEATLNNVLNILEYTVGSFIVYYRLCVEKILEMNPDVEIIFVGLLNTTYGMEIAVDENPENNFPVGDVMGGFFDMLSDYVKMVPALIKAESKYPKASFRFANRPEPKLIWNVFSELKENGWQDIQDGRLSGYTVRYRNVEAYNSALRPMFSAAFRDPLGGNELPEITLEIIRDIDSTSPTYSWAPSMGIHDPSNDIRMQLYVISTMLYLGIEDALAECAGDEIIPLESFVIIATDIFSAFQDFQADANDLRGSLASYFTSDDTRRGMCKIYLMLKVGNGMSLHPTPVGHDEVARSVIEAYANESLQYNKGFITFRDILCYLKENDYISADQLLDIIVKRFQMDDIEFFKELYNLVLIENDLSFDDRIAIIGNAYQIIKEHVVIEQCDFIDLAFAIYNKLMTVNLITSEQAFDIANYVYTKFIDDGISSRTPYEIATYTYNKLFFAPKYSAFSLCATIDDSLLGDEESVELTIAEKLEILSIVFDELKNSEYLEKNASLGSVVNLYDELATDGDVSEIALITTVDIAFAALEEKIDGDDEVVLAELFTTVNEKVLEADSIDEETKQLLVSKVEKNIPGSAVEEKPKPEEPKPEEPKPEEPKPEEPKPEEPKPESPEIGAEDEEPETFWDMVANFFIGIFDFFKNLFGITKED